MVKTYAEPPHAALVGLYEWLDALDLASRCGRASRSVREDFADGVLAAEALRLELLYAPIGFVPALPALCAAHGREKMRGNWSTLERVLRTTLGLSLRAEDIDAVVSLVPFAVETVLVQLQAALSVKIAAASLRRHQGQGRSWTRQQQREEHEQRFHHFLHSGEAQERRRRRRRKAPWYPP
jgi:hypothetical protein